MNAYGSALSDPAVGAIRTGRARAERRAARGNYERGMEITRSGIDTAKGPDDWFTGDVYIDAVPGGTGPRPRAGQPRPLRTRRTHRLALPPARPDHTSLKGLASASAAAAPSRSSAGDRVFFEPDEEHWHGAAPNRFMVHQALNDVDDDHTAAHWGEKVTDEEYTASPAREG